MAKQEKEISDERARVLSEQQRFVLDRRWEVEQEEIRKQQALETAQIQKEIAIIEEAKQREAAEIRRALATQLEEMSRDIALISKEGERERTDIEPFSPVNRRSATARSRSLPRPGSWRSPRPSG